jgi:hypothetical protein
MALPCELILGRRIRGRSLRAGILARPPQIQLLLLLLIPSRQTLEEAQGLLRSLIQRHLVLKLASRLGEGTSSFMDPHVAVYFVPLWGRRAGRNDAVDLVLEEFCISFSNKPKL